MNADVGDPDSARFVHLPTSESSSNKRRFFLATSVASRGTRMHGHFFLLLVAVVSFASTTYAQPAPPAPTASISVSPSAITVGSNASLTWSSTNATSCTGANFSTGGATSGTISVSPDVTTTYSVQCTGMGGTSQLVSFVVSVFQPLTGSCSVSPTSVMVGQSATWNANASGGTGLPVYSWSGSDGLNGSGTSIARTYATPGAKTASALVTAGLQSLTINCSGPLNVISSPLPDLTMGPAIFNSAIAGEVRAYVAYVGNTGNDATGAPFTTTFFFDTDQNNTNGNIGTRSVITGAPSGLVANYPPPNIPNAMVTFAFPTSGTYYYRACTDLNSSMSGGVISESNEGNNCSGWAPITVGAIQTVTGSTFSASCASHPITTNTGAGGNVTYTTTVTGGMGPITYSWTGTDNLTGSSWLAGMIYTIPGIKTATVIVTRGGESITVTCPNVTVVGPDFSAGTVTPTAATVGQLTELVSTISNIGTGNNFPNVYVNFQIEGEGGFSIPRITNNFSPPLAAGDSRQVTRTLIFYTPGTYTVRACVNQNTPGGTIFWPEHNTSNNCSNWTTLTVSAPALADLTAGPVIPATAVRGIPVVLSTTASNIGNTTSAPFPARFQIQSPVVSRESDYGTATAPGSRTASVSYTFPSTGSYQVRACANQNADGTFITTESDYGNNCGPWTTITVNDPAPAGMLSCNVSSTNPVPNTSVTYTVTPSGGATGPYVWNDTQGGSYGSGVTATRLIPDGGPYIMLVSGENVVTQPVSCPVVSGSCPAPSATISATPARVPEGATTTIAWAATGVNTSCTISGPGVSESYPATGCTLPNDNRSVEVTITRQSVYRISCDNGATESEVIVNLLPRFVDF